jgi:hypothetical protein
MFHQNPFYRTPHYQNIISWKCLLVQFYSEFRTRSELEMKDLKHWCIELTFSVEQCDAIYME